MFCDECGFKNKETAKFCKKCGASLEEEQQALVEKKEDIEKVLEENFDSSQDDMKLNKKQLLEYLNMGKELEINKLGLENGIKDLQDLDKKKYSEIVKPIQKKEKPRLSDAKDTSNRFINGILGGILGIAVFAAIPLYIVLMILCWKYGPQEWQRGFTLFLIPAGILIGVYVILGIVILILNIIIGNTFGRKRYKNDIKKYEEENKEIDEKNNKQIKLYNENKAIIDDRISNVKKDLKDVEKTMSQYYDLDVIYPKYRNLVALTTFIEYLESGRCKSLYGYTGCYNVYEQELRQNTIIGKLDQVLVQLDQIKKVQFATYLAIQQSNAIQSAMLNTCNEMLDETRRENAMLEAQAQDNKIIKRNSEITSTISTLNYIKHN